VTTATLRQWGGGVALSLPKKVLAVLGLEPGSQVDVDVVEGKIVLSPTRPRSSLEQLLSEQAELEQELGSPLRDENMLQSPPAGREQL
jgi:antitoxin ChpS